MIAKWYIEPKVLKVHKGFEGRDRQGDDQCENQPRALNKFSGHGLPTHIENHNKSH